MSDDRTTHERVGSVQLVVRASPRDPITMSMADYDAVLDAWTHGRTFYTGKDIWGDDVTVKLAEICAIGRETPDGIIRFQADDEILRERDRARDITGK